MMKKDGDSRNVFFEISFILQHGILGLLLVQQDLWRGCVFETKLTYKKFEKVEVAACVVGRERD